MRTRNYLLLLVASIIFMGCGDNGNKEKVDIQSLLQSDSGKVEISTESMNEIISSIPSPVEIAMVIKKSGTGFNENLLNRQDNSSLYTTDQSKALGIGIYSGDLGYINMYEKSILTVNYLNTIRKLADDINIGQFFDFKTIKRLASNSDKMDSLIYLSTINFNRMDAFLRDQQRSHMSLLMVTGTWTEGLYIATRNYLSSGSPEIMEWIGYQKIIVNQLVLGLAAYNDDAYFRQIINDLNLLKKLYDNINITYEYHEPESVEVDGKLVIVDKSTSRVDISSDQVRKISEVVDQMRTKLVHNQAV